MLFTVHSNGGFKRKPYSSLVLKIPLKNLKNKKTLVYSRIAFCRTEKQKNEGRKPDKNSNHSISARKIGFFRFFLCLEQ